MGLPYVHPSTFLKYYDTIGESGCSRCGELRTDGTRIFALFKAGVNITWPALGTDQQNNKLFITAYSGNDITVGFSNTPIFIGTVHIQELVPVDKYFWVCLRGISNRNLIHFDGAASWSIGAGLSSSGTVVRYNASEDPRCVSVVSYAPAEALKYSPVYMERKSRR